VDDAADAELRRLRARAYGPDADIHEDQQALQRLSELEDRRLAEPGAAAPDPGAAARAVTAAEAGENGHTAEPPEPPGLPEPPKPQPDAEVGDPAAAPAAPVRRRLRRGWVAAVWAVSLIVVALLAVAIAGALAAPPPLAAGADHIATLEESPAFVWPEFFGPAPEDVHGYEEFYGLTPIWGSGVFASDSTDGCLTLVPLGGVGDDPNTFNGEIFSGCGAGPFPPTIQIAVRGNLPPELLERFPEGTALQFVFDDGRIHVYAASE
jgi:hypothetical protein